MDPSTQMIYHKLNVIKPGSTVAMELKPPTNDSAFEIFVRKTDFPDDTNSDFKV